MRVEKTGLGICKNGKGNWVGCHVRTPLETLTCALVVFKADVLFRIGTPEILHR